MRDAKGHSSRNLRRSQQWCFWYNTHTLACSASHFSPKALPDPITAVELSKQGTEAKPGSKPQEDGTSHCVPALSLWY